MTIADQPRWLLWRYGQGVKPPKIPYGLNFKRGSIEATTGTLAQVKALWLTAPDAFNGLGYLPHIDDPYACLDFDDLTVHEAVQLWAIFSLLTYCEKSASGLPTKGHAIVTLNREAKERLKGIRNLIRHPDTGKPAIELYSNSGFFTVTLNALNNLPIFDASKLLTNIADHYNLYPPTPGTALPSCSALPIDLLRSMLKLIDPNCSWDDWFQAMAAVHAATGGSEEGKALVHEWGRTGAKYNDDSAKKIEHDWGRLDDSKLRYSPDKTLQILQRTSTNTRGNIPAGWAPSR